MKQFKIGLVAFMALAIGITVSAFTKQQPKPLKHLTSHWYQFRGDPTILTDVKDPTKYEYVVNPEGCDDGPYVCSIFVPGPDGTNDHPDMFTNTIKDDLENAFDHNGLAPYIATKSQQ